MAQLVAGRRPVLAFSQGDPAGIGPEILLKLLQDWTQETPWRPLLVAERAALEALRTSLPDAPWDRLAYLSSPPGGTGREVAPEKIPVLDPVGEARPVAFGRSTAADAGGAILALDAAVAAVKAGVADALVTAPVSKASIALHHLPGFKGHTEYLAEGAGLERYGRDYLMAFLAPGLQVALLSTHLPLIEAARSVSRAGVLDALRCLHRHAGGRIAVAGLNPHAGEGGLLGEEDDRELVPAVADARGEGIDAHGPVSADSLFARVRRREFDWALALYHDQGLVAVKTAAFGTAANWTLGLPYLRTSVDHGTAFEIAGKGLAEADSLRAVVEITLELLSGTLPVRAASKG